MASDKAFAADVVRRLVGFGPVTTRAMFGGFGVHCDGVMFGLIAYDTLYFRVDDGNLDDYRAAGAPPFT